MPRDEGLNQASLVTKELPWASVSSPAQGDWGIVGIPSS